MPTSHNAADWQRFVLLETLSLAVPMHMIELGRCTPDTLTEIATEAASFIGSHGDSLQFGGKQCAPAFNQLARGLAASALTAWGGVTFQGLHWCALPGCTNRDADHPQPYPTHAEPAPRPIVDLHLPEPTEEAA